MKDYKKVTEKLYETPSSVQELIPVCRIASDGIFQLEDRPKGAKQLFDKAYLFLDTNFATMDDFDKEEFLKNYCRILNSMSVSYKIVVMNNNQDMEKYRRDILCHNSEECFRGLVESYNRYMENALLKGHSGLEQARIFVVTCERVDIGQARDYFRSIEAGLIVNFGLLKSGLIPLDATGRLRYLHAFYRLGEESQFDFSFDQAVRKKIPWRDIIAPRILKHYQDKNGDFDGITVQVGSRFVRALYVPDLPSGINPDVIRYLTAGEYNVILTLDVAPVPQEVTRKRMQEVYMQTCRAIDKQQEARNKNMQWSTPISYEKQKELEEITEYMDILDNNDEKMSYLGFYAVISAEGKAALDSAVTSFCASAESIGFRFEPAHWQQIDTINTALPVGCRFVTNMYPLMTQPLAAITPFVVHELRDPNGIFYGINQISKNVVVGNRKRLMNGNGFIFGVSGSGKGYETKSEMVQVYLNYLDDDIIIIDPQNEYRSLVFYLGGQFVDFGAGAGQYLNPLDADTFEYLGKKAFLQDKSELVLALFTQIMDGVIDAQDKSLVLRALTAVYADIPDVGRLPKGYTVPTLVDLQAALDSQQNDRAGELALALERFTTGALDMFAKQSNVDIRSRFVAYGLADLGKEMSAIGMLIMLEGIRSRIALNAKKGKCTWLYVDEFHNLANNELSATLLQKTWVEVRKNGGLCTGITQNVAEALVSKSVGIMLDNSEYVNLLKCKPKDFDALQETVEDFSDNLRKYANNSVPGCGLLKFGDKFIPKDNRVPRDSEMYRLYNTNFHEIHKGKRREVKRIRDEIREQADMAAQPMEAARVDAGKFYRS